jgi:hypothetical protein
LTCLFTEEEEEEEEDNTEELFYAAFRTNGAGIILVFIFKEGEHSNQHLGEISKQPSRAHSESKSPNPRRPTGRVAGAPPPASSCPRRRQPPPQVSEARSFQMDPSEPPSLFPGQERRPIESLPRNSPFAGCAAGSSPLSPSQSTRVDAFR